MKLRIPRWFVGGFTELKRPTFDVNDKLERDAYAARIAMGEVSLIAKPVPRKDAQPPVDYVQLGVIE